MQMVQRWRRVKDALASAHYRAALGKHVLENARPRSIRLQT